MEKMHRIIENYISPMKICVYTQYDDFFLKYVMHAWIAYNWYPYALTYAMVGTEDVSIFVISK